LGNENEPICCNRDRRKPRHRPVYLYSAGTGLLSDRACCAKCDRTVNTGALVTFARSGIAAHWKASAYRSILELAEACDVPVRWSCRTGVCHNCESGLVSGAVVYGPEPLDKPADGNLLICCSQPIRDVVIDL